MRRINDMGASCSVSAQSRIMACLSTVHEAHTVVGRQVDCLCSSKVTIYKYATDVTVNIRVRDAFPLNVYVNYL